jgi:hypothetical protein
MRQVKKALRGRPALVIEMAEILGAVRRHGQVIGAARELRCSPSYIHARLKAAGLTLLEVLES